MAVAVMNDEFVVTEVNEDFTSNILNRRATVGSGFVSIFEKGDQSRVREALYRDNDALIGVASREAGPTGTVVSSEAEELKDFFNKAPIALHWLSDSGRVLWANDRELEVLGYSREEYIGANIMDFCPDSKDDVLEIFKQLGTGNTIRDVPVRFRTKAGKVQHLLIDSNVNYRPDGSFNHTRCFIRDDTGRILTEARVGASAAAARKLSEGKERFSSRLLQALRALTGLLASVSKAMKFDDGYFVQPVPTPFNIFSLLQEYRKIEGVGHEVVVETIGFNRSLVVLADAKMIRAVLEQLVMHADERSPDGAPVHLSVECTKGGEVGGQPGMFEFKVLDNGHELEESRVERAFHNYWLGDEGVQESEENSEASSSPRESSSCGEATTLYQELSSAEAAPALRLNVAFNYVQCMDSTLRVYSDAIRTIFKFTLTVPIAQSHQEETMRRDIRGLHRWNKIAPSVPPLHSVSSTPLKRKPLISLCDSDAGKHILIAEDNTICQKLCKKVVVRLGNTADTADNGAIAVEMVGKTINIYDLVLMDIRMPVMDGITAAKRIHEAFPELPIVAFSAEESESTREAALEVMVAFMPKPTNAAGVDEVIRKYARRPLVSMSCS
ncbi:unnamed protein product [Scytosiphon promiscuus]